VDSPPRDFRPGPDADPTTGLAPAVVASIACRTTLNTARRFIYPFAPDLSRALGVPLTAVTGLIALNWATNLLGLALAPLADRIGYRRMMIAGMVLPAVGMLAAGAAPVLAVVALAQLLCGLGKSVFDPAVQAYVSARVPYRRRGLVIGFLETAWAASTLVGIPALGFLIDRAGWRAAFLALGASAVIGLVLIAAATSGREVPRADRPRAAGFREGYRRVLRSPAALGIVGFAFWYNVAMDNLFVVYGAWLEEAFGMTLVAVGMGTGVIGAAELAGEFLTAGFADRLGLKRASIGGVAACVLTYAALPWVAVTVPLALGGLFVHFCMFEMTVVTVLSLTTELLPGARATMISAYYAAAGLGRVAGALLGGAVWLSGGITAIALVSAAVTVVALGCLVLGLRGWNGA
jgi:predicted MFS family arabinose efflux permease